MKNAFEKIKKLLPYCDVEVKYKSGDKRKFVAISEEGELIKSKKGSPVLEESKIIKITPIPRIVPEIKGLVDIIDCEELREMSEIDGWDIDKEDMIGKKGLKATIQYCNYANNNYSFSGEKYYVINGSHFPAWAVCPHIEDENKDRELKVDNETFEAIQLLKENGYKITKK